MASLRREPEETGNRQMTWERSPPLRKEEREHGEQVPSPALTPTFWWCLEAQLVFLSQAFIVCLKKACISHRHSQHRWPLGFGSAPRLHSASCGDGYQAGLTLWLSPAAMATSFPPLRQWYWLELVPCARQCGIPGTETGRWKDRWVSYSHEADVPLEKDGPHTHTHTHTCERLFKKWDLSWHLDNKKKQAQGGYLSRGRGGWGSPKERWSWAVAPRQGCFHHTGAHGWVGRCFGFSYWSGRQLPFLASSRPRPETLLNILLCAGWPPCPRAGVEKPHVSRMTDRWETEVGDMRSGTVITWGPRKLEEGSWMLL